MHGIEGFGESVEYAVIGQIAQNLFIQSTRCRVSRRKVFEASFGRLQAGVGESGEHTCHILPGLLFRQSQKHAPLTPEDIEHLARGNRDTLLSIDRK